MKIHTKWLQPPIFSNEEDKTRRALLLNVILNTFLIALPVLFINTLFIDSFPRQGSILVILVCAWLTIFGLRLLMLSGRVTLAGICAVLILLLATTLAICTIGTIRAPATSFYLLAIVTAGLTISRRSIVWVTSFCSLVIFALLLAEMNGMLPAPSLPVSIAQGINLTVIYITTSILLSLAIKSIEQALLSARQELTERIQAEEREQNRRKVMEKVISIGKNVTEVADLRTTLRRILDGVRNGLDFDRAAVFLYDQENNSMQGSFGTDRLGEISEEWGLTFKIEGESFFLNVLDKPDGYYFTTDYETERGLLTRPGHIMRGVKYYAAVAVWAGEKPVALICVDQLITGRAIKDEQLEALRFFAGYAGLAIENARLSEREQNRQKMMEKVIRIGKEVTVHTNNLRTTLLKIRNSVQNELDFDRVAIFLYDQKDNTLQGTYGTDRSGKMSDEWDLKMKPLQEGLFNRPNGYYFTQNYGGDFSFASDPDHPMWGVKYYAAAACWSGDSPVGYICVDQLISGRIITEEQLEALRLFAGYAGLSIENARLHTELDGRVQELANRNAELERFTYTVSHDLRSPLVTIRGFLGMLEKDMGSQQVEKAAHDMSRIANATDKMDVLLTDLLELSRVGRIVNPPEEVNLNKLTRETLETIDGRIRAKNVTVHVSPNLPTLFGDRTRLREVMENLIDNAAKYMGDQPNPMIEIGVREQGNEHIIYVKDNGLGIESQYLTKVFGLFEKLNPASEGTGIGLALIKRIIEVHNGRIWVESDGLGKGSTFCFTLPLRENSMNQRIHHE